MKHGKSGYGDKFPFGGSGPSEFVPKQTYEEGDDCPECGDDLVVKVNSSSGNEFVGCSGYSNGCRFTANLRS